MKKAGIALAVMMTGTLLFGCAGGGNETSMFSPVQSSIFVTREGSFTSALVEAYEPDYYVESELKASIEEAVAGYNTEKGDTEVTLSSCTLGNGKAIALFDYKSGDSLCDFAREMEDEANQTSVLKFSTVNDGLVAGNIMDGSWKKAKDGSSVSTDVVLKNGELKLVTVEGAATIQTEGKILYYSGDVTLTDNFTAVLGGGRSYLIFK